MDCIIPKKNTAISAAKQPMAWLFSHWEMINQELDVSMTQSPPNIRSFGQKWLIIMNYG